MRVRKVISGRSPRALYKFPSIRQGRTVYCESSHEFNYAHLLEFDQDVLAYQEQPLTLPYCLEGKRHRYTPDFQVDRRACRPELVEVKPTEQCSKAENQRMFRAVKTAADEAGYGFVVMDSDQINKEPRLRNVKLLWKYSCTPVNPQHQLFCTALFSCVAELSLGAVFESFRAKGYSQQVVYSLIYHGMLTVDLTLLLNASSILSLPGRRSNGERN